MKREEYAFAYNLNGTGTPGIVTLTNPPRLICLCSKENSRLILDALNSSLPPAEGANCFYYDKPGKEKVTPAQQPTAEGAEEILPTAYEWHNLKTGHCYVDYVPHLDAKEGYTKIPLYSTLHAQKIADKMVEWISVKDKLPEEHEDVLCYNGYRISSHNWCKYTDQDDKWFERTFTHWCKLPNIPKP